MHQNDTLYCNVRIYFQFCASVRSVLITPGLTINLLILISVFMCLNSRKNCIKTSIVAYVVGSTAFNIINLLSWPLMIDWRIYEKWRFSSTICELMVYIKQIASTISFYYVSCISFSIYIAIVFGYKIDEHRLFTFFQLFFPCFVLMSEELLEHLLGWKDSHYDFVYETCFTIINDQTMKIRMLFKILLGLPLTAYFYLHILLTIFKSAQLMKRSQATNKKLAKMFSSICLITFIAHIPGGILPIIADKNICLETATEFLFDLPIFTNPIILFCMNKELRIQCKKLMGRRSRASSSSQSTDLVATADDNQGMPSSSESKLESDSSAY
ncbi:C-X-C chemokine receptor type 2-like [Bufo bufo]|uniref:C-X-C chemokine receptor type 2-like n=1 Tax=Bufo bufo TaxID=8384 RepID=UPI001ABDE47A|nr:C-X-C chemokine receptor type 2-like [Bufo bufo]